MYQETFPWTVNYDENSVPDFTLPDPLVTQEGKHIATPEQWQDRRKELLQMFQEVMYGRELPPPDHLETKLISQKPDDLGGLATRKELNLTMSMYDGRSHSITVLLYVPNQKNAKVPVFLGLTFAGNHVVTEDEDIQITGLALQKHGKLDMQRGAQTRRFPLETIIKRGYAIAVASYNDIFPDAEKGWQDSIYNLFFSQEELTRRPQGVSAIGAWAWGLSRILDGLQDIPQIDTRKAAVFGHSRLGKTSLWAGVLDQRFKLVCVNDSGCGGSALSRRLYGETLFSMYSQNAVGKWWFTDTLENKAIRPELLPIDQHELLALVAPRMLAVHSATEDQWADPKGEYLSAFNAGKVFKLLGKTPLENPEPPAPDTPVGTDVSYFLRTGKHDLLLADWMHYLDCADRCFNPKP